MSIEEQSYSCNTHQDSFSNIEEQKDKEGSSQTLDVERINSNYSLEDQTLNYGIFYQLTTKMKETFFTLNAFQKIFMICGFGLFLIQFIKLFTKNYSIPFFLGIGIPIIIFSLFTFTYKKEKPQKNASTTN